MNSGERLRARLHSVFERDADPAPALQIEGPRGWRWSVAEGVVRLTAPRDATVAWEPQRLSDLVTTINAQQGYRATLLNADFSSLTTHALLDGEGDQAVLSAQTSILWTLTNAIGGFLEAASEASANAIRHIAFDQANGYWLDAHGAHYGIPRLTGELDAMYLERILAEILRPRSNNRAIAIAFGRAFPWPSAQIDVRDAAYITYTPGSFITHDRATFDLRVTGRYPHALTRTSIYQALETTRAAGTALRYLEIDPGDHVSGSGIAAVLSRPTIRLDIGAQSSQSVASDLALLGVAAVMGRPVVCADLSAKSSQSVASDLALLGVAAVMSRPMQVVWQSL